MKYVVCYDIEDNKTRKKVADQLGEYGNRVNYSVFECELNQTKLKKLKKSLEDVVDKGCDSIRFYHICKNCLPKSFELCNKEEIFEEEELYI